MGDLTDYESLDAVALADLVKRGETTPSELLECAIRRLERHDEVLRAVPIPMLDEARRVAEEPLPDGPLRGVPFLLKDLHLLYAGFATNICVQHRDYGMRAMRDRGYHLILLRDGTAGIEFGESIEGGWLTRGAIMNIEMKVGASITSEQLQQACRIVSRRSP